VLVDAITPPGADAVRDRDIPNEVKTIVGKRFGAYYQKAAALHGESIPKANNREQEIPSEQIPFQLGTEIGNEHLGIDDSLGGGSDREEVPVDDFTDAKNILIKRTLAEIIANLVTRPF